jgi:ABC-2 type transport system permease protein
MRGFKTVFNYEFKTLFSKKSAIISTAIVALVVFLLFNIPRFILWFSNEDNAENERNPYEIIVKDTSYVFEDKQMLESIKSMLNLKDEKIYSSRDELINAIENGDVNMGFVVEGPLKYESIWLNKELEYQTEIMFSEILKQLNITSMLIEKGVSPQEAIKLQSMQPESTSTILGKDRSSNTMVAFILLFIVYILVLMYGNVTSTIIAREKDSRTMELLITSTKASNLILGKVAASGLSAVIQMSIIALAGFIGFTINKELMPEYILSALSGTLTREYIISYLYFTITGYILYLFLYAALGSTVSKVEDVASSTGPISFLFVLGYFSASFAMQDPDSLFVVITSIIPFTSLMVMPFRFAVSAVPVWQYLLSGGLLLVTTVLLAMLSIRIYRQGTLNYGNKIGLMKSIKLAFTKN